MEPGLYHLFFKGQDNGIFFFLGKGHSVLSGNCKCLLEHFKGIKAMSRGHEGNRPQCLRELSGLGGWPLLNSRPDTEMNGL